MAALGRLSSSIVVTAVEHVGDMRATGGEWRIHTNTFECAPSRLELSSDTEVAITVGKSSIRITPERIELASPAIASTGSSGAMSVGSDGVALKSDGARVVMGQKLVVQTSAASFAMDKEMQLDGSRILLNSAASASDAPAEEPPPPTQVELVDQNGASIA